VAVNATEQRAQKAGEAKVLRLASECGLDEGGLPRPHLHRLLTRAALSIYTVIINSHTDSLYKTEWGEGVMTAPPSSNRLGLAAGRAMREPASLHPGRAPRCGRLQRVGEASPVPASGQEQP